MYASSENFSALPMVCEQSNWISEPESSANPYTSVRLQVERIKISFYTKRRSQLQDGLILFVADGKFALLPRRLFFYN